MRAKEFIVEKKIGKISKRAQQPSRGINTYGDSEHVSGDYTSYRNCCRWEFGFCCALCFVHEGDLVEDGAEGTGLVWIEHSELKSVQDDRRDDYSNCFLSCRFCNNGRGTRPSVEPKSGAKLLNPTTASWSECFVVGADYVMTERDSTDKNARHTRVSYALDLKTKAARRARRADRFLAVRKAATAVETLVPRLLEKAQTSASEDKRLVLEAARSLIDAYDRARAEVARYVAVPVDAPSKCRCSDESTGTSTGRSKMALPDWLAVQLQVIPSSKFE